MLLFIFTKIFSDFLKSNTAVDFWTSFKKWTFCYVEIGKKFRTSALKTLELPRDRSFRGKINQFDQFLINFDQFWRELRYRNVNADFVARTGDRFRCHHHDRYCRSFDQFWSKIRSKMTKIRSFLQKGWTVSSSGLALLTPGRARSVKTGIQGH